MIPRKGTVLLTMHKHCPGCVALKKKLDKAHIPFKEVYVDDPKPPRWVTSVLVQGVPQLFHDGTMVQDGDINAWVRRNR